MKAETRVLESIKHSILVLNREAVTKTISYSINNICTSVTEIKKNPLKAMNKSRTYINPAQTRQTINTLSQKQRTFINTENIIIQKDFQ